MSYGKMENPDSNVITKKFLEYSLGNPLGELIFYEKISFRYSMSTIFKYVHLIHNFYIISSFIRVIA